MKVLSKPLSIVFFLLSFSAHAQVNCDQNDIRIASIDSAAVQIIEDQIYATKYNPASRVDEDLLLDIYYTDELASGIPRPLVMLSHGGAFVGGEKESMDEIARIFASLGYVAVTHSYRLTDALTTAIIEAPLGLQRAAIRATDDLIDAIEYMKDAASEYSIDTTSIVLGGASAGAFMALHLAYADSDDDMSSVLRSVFEEFGPRVLTYPIQDIRAVVNLSGAILDTSWLQNNNIPTYSIHGDMDDVVPYGSGLALGLVPVYGSGVISETLDRSGVSNSLVTVPGGNHSNIYSEEQYADYVNEFVDTVIEGCARQICTFSTSVSDISVEKTIQPILYPNPASDYILLNDLSEETRIKSIRIIDITGKTTATISSPQKVLSLSSRGIDLSSLSNGMYILEITGNEQVYRLSFIKQ